MPVSDKQKTLILIIITFILIGIGSYIDYNTAQLEYCLRLIEQRDASDMCNKLNKRQEKILKEIRDKRFNYMNASIF